MAELLLHFHIAADDAAFTREMLVPMLVVLGIVLLAVMFTVMARSKIANRQAGRLSARQQIDQIKAAGRKRSEQTGTSAEDVDRVRHLAVLLDNKAERLEQLIVEADRRIATLRGDLEHEPHKQDGAESRSDERGIGRDDASSEMAAANDQPEHRRGMPKEPLDPLTRSVYDLADEGRTPVEIARELDEQVGKVDLILALREGGGRQ